MNPSNHPEICPKSPAEYATDDPCHRYALRRELLCSEVFEGNRAAAERWDMFIAVTSAAFAGGVLAVIILTITMTPRDSVRENIAKRPYRDSSQMLPSREVFYIASPPVAFDISRQEFYERVVGR